MTARSMRTATLAALTGALLLSPMPAGAADLKVLTAGAMKAVVIALQPEFEKTSGHQLVIDNDTAGGLAKRIGGGEAFDVAIITPGVVADLAKSGQIVAGSGISVAKVGVGVAIKEGAPKPDISTVDGFKRALLAAKTVGYIDPKSGGSSGIYVAGLLQKLGIAEEIKPKERLQMGGYIAELAAKGEADIVIHQISEILPVKGAILVGPLPAEIQNYTTYAAGLSTATKDAAAARALIEHLKGPAATEVLKQKGMERP